MTRARATAECRSDPEIFTDFARMLALRALLDELHATRTGEHHGVG